MVTAGPGLQRGLCHTPPGTAQAVGNCGLLCSFSQVVPGRSRAVTDLGLHQEAPEPICLEVGFKQQRTTQVALPEGVLNGHQSHWGKYCSVREAPHTAAHKL